MYLCAYVCARAHLSVCACVHQCVCMCVLGCVGRGARACICVYVSVRHCRCESVCLHANMTVSIYV